MFIRQITKVTLPQLHEQWPMRHLYFSCYLWASISILAPPPLDHHIDIFSRFHFFFRNLLGRIHEVIFSFLSSTSTAAFFWSSSFSKASFHSSLFVVLRCYYQNNDDIALISFISCYPAEAFLLAPRCTTLLQTPERVLYIASDMLLVIINNWSHLNSQSSQFNKFVERTKRMSWKLLRANFWN